MTIGQYEFTSAKYHTANSTTAVNLTFQDDKIQVFKGQGAKEVRLPTPKESNTFGEVWIINEQTQNHALTLKNNVTGGAQGILAQQADVSVAQNKQALCRYIPQRTKYDQYGNAVPKGSWIVIVGA